MTDELDPYKPIACNVHSEYELAVMRRTRLRLAWREASGQRRIGWVLPLDIYSRRGVEYMVVQSHDGDRHEIRLDKILSAAPRNPIYQ